MNAKWIGVLVFGAVLLAAGGCSGKHEQVATGVPQGNAAAVTALSSPASLRAVLPANTVAYLRIPSPWGFLAAPKGTVLNPALGSAANLQAVEKLRKALYANVLKELPPPDDLLSSLLLYQIRSPIELALLRPTQSMPSAPSVLLSVRLAATDLGAVNDLFEHLAAASGGLSLARKLVPGGVGMLIAGPSPIYFSYDLKTRTLYMMGGPSVTDTGFQQTLKNLAPTRDRRMDRLEARIDSSHQGFFAWLDVRAMMGLMGVVVPPEKRAELEHAGIGKVSQIAVGWGASNGKGRLKLIADVPNAGWDRYFARLPADIALDTAGEPKTVVALAMPDSTQWKRIETFLRERSTPKEFQDYLAAKARFRRDLGLSFEDMLDALGPDVLVFEDQVGPFLAVRVRDPARLQHVVTALSEVPGARYETRTMGGHIYHHLSLPPLWSDLSKPRRARRVPLFMKLWVQRRSHFYWSEDDGYLVFGAVPQLLRDRFAYGKPVRIGAWLKNQQRQDVHDTVALASTRIADSPRRLYYVYLSMLQFLGDVGNQPVDLFALPSAMDVKLPRSGTYGVQLDLGSSSTALELTFENDPLEFLLGQNMTGVAVAGVLAAIAIPAYEQYTLRAVVSGALVGVQPLKESIEKFHVSHGHFPSANEVDQLATPAPDPHVRGVEVAAGSGAITIHFGGGARWVDKYLRLTPVPGAQGRIRWQCTSNLAPALWARYCR